MTAKDEGTKNLDKAPPTESRPPEETLSLIVRDCWLDKPGRSDCYGGDHIADAIRAAELRRDVLWREALEADVDALNRACVEGQARETELLRALRAAHEELDEARISYVKAARERDKARDALKIMHRDCLSVWSPGEPQVPEAELAAERERRANEGQAWHTRCIDAESRGRERGIEEAARTWREALLKADAECMRITLDGHEPCCAGCRPLRALLSGNAAPQATPSGLSNTAPPSPAASELNQGAAAPRIGRCLAEEEPHEFDPDNCEEWWPFESDKPEDT